MIINIWFESLTCCNQFMFTISLLFILFLECEQLHVMGNFNSSRFIISLAGTNHTFVQTQWYVIYFPEQWNYQEYIWQFECNCFQGQRKIDSKISEYEWSNYRIFKHIGKFFLYLFKSGNASESVSIRLVQQSSLSISMSQGQAQSVQKNLFINAELLKVQHMPQRMDLCTNICIWQQWYFIIISFSSLTLEYIVGYVVEEPFRWVIFLLWKYHDSSYLLD